MEIQNASDKSISKFIRSIMPKETTDEELKEAEINFKRYLEFIARVCFTKDISGIDLEN